MNNSVYGYFLAMFPSFQGRVRKFVPLGSKSVRIHIMHGETLVFTFNGEKDYILQTLNNYKKEV